MDFLQSLLAGLLDKFKTKNPIVFAIVAVVLITINQAAANAIEWNLLDPESSPWIQRALEILSQILIVLTGSRTVRFMSNPSDDPAQLAHNPDYQD